MSPPRTFTFHLRGATQHTPGDAEILDAIQAHLRESGEIPGCNRSQALRWALNRFTSVDSPVFEHLPQWWQLYRRHHMQDLGVGDLIGEADAERTEAGPEEPGEPGEPEG